MISCARTDLFTLKFSWLRYFVQHMSAFKPSVAKSKAT